MRHREAPPPNDELFAFSRERDERAAIVTEPIFIGVLRKYYVGQGDDTVECWSPNMLNALELATDERVSEFSRVEHTRTRWTCTHRKRGYVVKVRAKHEER